MELDLPSRNFQPRIYGVGAWTENLSFAYDLVAILRPRLLVELGTDRGESYFAFCQSVAENQTGTHCFAVDTWRGDAQAGQYDETTFAEVLGYNREYYQEFSALLRCSFDQALARFADESIDLLHLDGLHTEEAVRHDVGNWLPKITPGGILLLHDINVLSRDFGVWKIWRELRERGRSFVLGEIPGLGFWQKPPVTALPAALENLFNDDDQMRSKIGSYYRDRAEETQRKIAQHWSDGTVRSAPFANQTIVQVFYSRDGGFRDEDSVLARIGHGEWKNVQLTLPVGIRGRLRLDVVSPCTTIEVESLRILADDGAVLFAAETPAQFDRIQYQADVERLPDSHHLRLRVTGIDPQLYLPEFSNDLTHATLNFDLKLRVKVD